ncbi:VOC family protein [Angustibacter aerolatus]
MARTVQIVFDAANPRAVGDFWADVLGYVMDPPPPGFDTWEDALAAWHVPEDQWDRAWAIVDPDGVGPRVFIQKVPEGKTVKNRVHLDVRVSSADDDVPTREAAVLAETERLEGLGATRVDWIEEQGKHFMVLRDPEGNEFCLS